MLLLFSFIMVFGFSIYFYICYSLKKKNENSPVSKCVPMMLGMTSSLTIGLVLASWLPHRLVGAAILSVLVSAGLAFSIGKGFGISGIMEAQSASLMGALMGAMLGVMLSGNEITLMILAMDFFYLVSIFTVLLLLTKNSEGKKQTQPAAVYLVFLLAAGLVGTVGILDLDHGDRAKPETEMMMHMDHNQ